MAIKKVDALPPATRGGSLLTAEDLAEIKESAGSWFLVKEKATTAQSFATFCKTNDGFEYTTRSAGMGENSNGKEVRIVDVYLRFNPEGKKD